MRTGSLLASIAIFALLAPLGCASTVPATVTARPTSPLSANGVYFVTANRQRERVVQSLRDAGLRTTDTLNNADYALDVRVGSKRGSAKDCGTVHNIAYILKEGGRRVMVIKGRGATGTCVPNVFDDMSKQLAAARG